MTTMLDQHVFHSAGAAAGKLGGHVTAVALAGDAKTGGYWILKSDGGVADYNAPWYGSPGRAGPG
ncbi:MAG TPA: hypothetical protein VG164_07650 [Trebonia sp.]|jgi:hypothetical protein|nr:hypothetical protein [Trebonia sp.]